jgi:hypothetical protein
MFVRTKSFDHRRNHRCRLLALETLENRVFLTAVPPTVMAVNVGSTEWTSAFVGYLESQGLGTGGYAVPTGNNQLKPLPWTDLNKILITFSQDVKIHAADLSVSGANTTAYAFSDFSYDSVTHTATWTLATPLAKEKILMDLDGDGISPVRNADGLTLDGQWTNGSSSFPSGNSQGGADFEFRVNILPGDMNQSTVVNNTDSLSVRLKVGKNAGDAGYDIFKDIDGSASITMSDYNLVVARLANQLPSGNPAGMTNDAPTAMPLKNLGVQENAVDTVLSLGDIFHDAEDPAEDLTFSIVNNTNPSLFSSVTIEDGKLILSYAPDTEDTADITLRAMDQGGLIVDTKLTVIVADTIFWVPNNEPPEISNFIGAEGPGHFWTYTGNVTDPDEDAEGFIITFGGILEGYGYTAIVQANGTFSITEEYIGLVSGAATAQTSDSFGELSNLAIDMVTVTG